MEACALTAATTRLDAIATTARRATTGTCPNPSRTGKPARVHRPHFIAKTQFLRRRIFSLHSTAVFPPNYSLNEEEKNQI